MNDCSAETATIAQLETRVGELKAAAKRVHANMLDGKMVVGEVEYATVEPGNLRLEGRIDSGATTTSLDATQIESFERDGKRWVRFSSPTGRGDQRVTLELPRARHVRIKGEGEETERRPVVIIELQVGRVRQRIEATLADRTNYEYPLLIGRNFLRDNVVIDISRRHVQGPKDAGGKR